MSNKKLQRKLIAEIKKLQPEDELEFLAGILTPAELEEIPMRLEIVKLLKSGMSQRDVAEKLGVGIATVSRGARELKLGRFKNV